VGGRRADRPPACGREVRIAFGQQAKLLTILFLPLNLDRHSI